MEVVINIPKEEYNRITKGKWEGNPLADYIENGTPLPKGHGRLIDADAYIESQEECGWLDDIPVDEFNEITPTIIEADAESEG